VLRVSNACLGPAMNARCTTSFPTAGGEKMMRGRDILYRSEWRQRSRICDVTQAGALQATVVRILRYTEYLSNPYLSDQL
jgi:hypothetical protein